MKQPNKGASRKVKTSNRADDLSTKALSTPNNRSTKSNPANRVQRPIAKGKKTDVKKQPGKKKGRTILYLPKNPMIERKKRLGRNMIKKLRQTPEGKAAQEEALRRRIFGLELLDPLPTKKAKKARETKKKGIREVSVEKVTGGLQAKAQGKKSVTVSQTKSVSEKGKSKESSVGSRGKYNTKKQQKIREQEQLLLKASSNKKREGKLSVNSSKENFGVKKSSGQKSSGKYSERKEAPAIFAHHELLNSGFFNLHPSNSKTTVVLDISDEEEGPYLAKRKLVSKVAQQRSISPVKSILKTSPVYSPMKSHQRGEINGSTERRIRFRDQEGVRSASKNSAKKSEEIIIDSDIIDAQVILNDSRVNSQPRSHKNPIFLANSPSRQLGFKLASEADKMNSNVHEQSATGKASRASWNILDSPPTGHNQTRLSPSKYAGKTDRLFQIPESVQRQELALQERKDSEERRPRANNSPGRVKSVESSVQKSPMRNPINQYIEFQYLEDFKETSQNVAQSAPRPEIVPWQQTSHKSTLSAQDELKRTSRETVQLMRSQLESTAAEDTRNNALLLAEVIKNFSLSFGLSCTQIMEIIFAKHSEGLNAESLRKQLLLLSAK